MFPRTRHSFLICTATITLDSSGSDAGSTGATKSRLTRSAFIAYRQPDRIANAILFASLFESKQIV